MKSIARILFFILLWASQAPLLIGQIEISRSVFGTMGGENAGAGFQLMYNIGEPFVVTSVGGDIQFTQGFEQPNDGLLVNITTQSATCNTATDGQAHIAILGSGSYRYVFESEEGQLNSDSIVLSGLLPGVYEVYIQDQITELEGSYQFTILSLTSDPCGVYVYTGISPNGDGVDDTWFIEHIEEYPDNHVYIFDRWGNTIWETKGYDNQTNVWNGKRFNQTELPTGTYYYIIEITGLETKKGWVQITK